MNSTATLIADAYLADALHWLTAADDAAAAGNRAQAADYQLLADASLALAGL
ncbi:hypothetical protein [Streptomyces sp. NPDC051997]|uniref:hypothetical protein n=1 Tax=Streptomyces sp. NPDC051997 TaxID=3155611 RepID=UPI003415503F